MQQRQKGRLTMFTTLTRAMIVMQYWDKQPSLSRQGPQVQSGSKKKENNEPSTAVMTPGNRDLAIS